MPASQETPASNAQLRLAAYNNSQRLVAKMRRDREIRRNAAMRRLEYASDPTTGYMPPEMCYAPVRKQKSRSRTARESRRAL